MLISIPQRAVSCLFLALTYITAQTVLPATSAYPGGEVTEIRVMDAPGSVKITCPVGTSNVILAPGGFQQGGESRVFREPVPYGRGVPVGSLLPGAKYFRVDSDDVLYVPRLPERETFVYFNCASPYGVWWLGIQVSSRAGWERRETPADEVEVNLRVTAANQQVQFECTKGKKVFPDDGNTYKEDCTTEVPLSRVVPGARLTTGKGAGSAVVFAVTELPTPAVVICYACAATASAEPELIRFVKIHVGHSEPKESRPTAGTTPRAAPGLGFLLVLTVLWRSI